MFHLFNRVYLDHDHNVDLSTRRVVLSDDYGDNLDEDTHRVMGEFLIFNSNNPSTLNSSDIYDIVSPLVKLEEKVIIYCDVRTYARIVALWLKSLVKGSTMRLYSLLMQSIDLREMADWGTRRHGILLTSNNRLHDIWEKADPCDKLIKFTTKDGLSIISAEFHILRFVLGDVDCGPLVQKSLDLMVRRAFHDFGRERLAAEQMTIFNNLTKSEMLHALATDGKDILTDRMVKDATFDLSVEVAKQILHITPNSDEVGNHLDVVLGGLFNGEYPVMEVLESYTVLSAQPNPALSVISSGDIGQFNFPFINGLMAHKEILLKDVTL